MLMTDLQWWSAAGQGEICANRLHTSASYCNVPTVTSGRESMFVWIEILESGFRTTAIDRICQKRKLPVLDYSLPELWEGMTLTINAVHIHSTLYAILALNCSCRSAQCLFKFKLFSLIPNEKKKERKQRKKSKEAEVLERFQLHPTVSCTAQKVK